MRHDTAVPIGSGGMGEVFKAWDPELERWVALKYLRSTDPELVERLFREARAQARIDHPCVCKVYEVGEDEGKPFIAMEYVHGKLLDQAAADLSLEQKVVLIEQVAEAVDSAHSAGLIHRDLKPGNIMVSEGDDGRLRPYVLDFGIARSQEVAGLTVTGQVLGTPGYLSPEQARGETNLDRRTDVFSLGVILYELLGGTRPFAGESSIEILVNLLEADPPPLCKVAPSIPRDLETVVFTCMEKDPARRYPSARALAEDLRRFLDGEPVEARPITLAQRLGRKARKHKVATALVGTLTLAAVILLGALVFGWVKYTVDLKRERDVAERKEKEAREVTDFLIDVFRVSDPNVSKGETVTARELLDQGAERIQASFENRPLVKARLMHTIGAIYRSLALLPEAEELLTGAMQIRESELPAEHIDIAEVLGALAIVHAEQGRLDEAEKLFRRAAEIKLAALGEDDPSVAASLSHLAILLGLQGRHGDAIPVLEQVIEVRTTAFGDDHPTVAQGLSALGTNLGRQGRYDEAEQAYRRAITIEEKTHGTDSPILASTLASFAGILVEIGKNSQAEVMLLRALSIQEKALGSEHPKLAITLNNLGNLYRKLDRYEEEKVVLERALSLRQAAYGPDHPQVGNTLNSIGNLLRAQGRFGEAEPYFLRALGIWEKALGPRHINLVYGLNSYGHLKLAQDNAPAAQKLFQRAMAIADGQMTEDHPERASTQAGLGTAHLELGNPQAAEPLLRHAYEVRLALRGADNQSVINTRKQLAQCLSALGRNAEAATLESANQ